MMLNIAVIGLDYRDSAFELNLLTNFSVQSSHGISK